MHQIDQNTAIAVDTSGHINVWDNRQSLLQHHRIDIDDDPTMVVRSSTLSADSRLLIIGTELSESQMDDNNDGRDSDGVDTTVEEHVHDDLVKSIHYDRESQMLFTGDDVGRVIGRCLIVDHPNELSISERSSLSRKRRESHDRH